MDFFCLEVELDIEALYFTPPMGVKSCRGLAPQTHWDNFLIWGIYHMYSVRVTDGYRS
jgi:hypothetical protein